MKTDNYQARSQAFLWGDVSQYEAKAWIVTPVTFVKTQLGSILKLAADQDDVC
jgi:hypothetical protein